MRGICLNKHDLEIRKLQKLSSLVSVSGVKFSTSLCENDPGTVYNTTPELQYRDISKCQSISAESLV